MELKFGSEEVWSSLIEQCAKGNMSAIKLYYDLLEKSLQDELKSKSGDLEMGVVIVDDIKKKRGGSKE